MASPETLQCSNSPTCETPILHLSPPSLLSQGEPRVTFALMMAVSPEKQEALARRMAELGVRESDLEESFVKSGGHGGQNVNKTSTCVMLLHRPTGLQVKCQTTRQQGINRFLARKLLLDKIEEQLTGRVAAEQARIEKIRRQKRKRSRRAKARMLADKAHHSDKKSARSAGDWSE